MNVVRAHQLTGLVDEAIDSGIKLLSLDCFDTLIWRTTHQPTDVFKAAQMKLRRPARIQAEDEARRLQRVDDGRSEVRIEAIYARAFEDQPARTEAVEAELAAERAHCFAFAPTVALIRAARAAGLRVIIVSDTYLAAAQLRSLIAGAAGDEIADAIERLYCSCEHGLSKADGLLREVLKDLRLPPTQVLHIGDNRAADFDAATRAGLRAYHFEQFDSATEQQLRLETAALALFDPAVRAARPHYQPQRACLSRGLAQIDDSGVRVGYACLGPILYAFARWLQQQAEQWTSHRQPKLLFLMRDGHLPKQVYDALSSDDHAPAFAVEISRFTAFGASFRSQHEIDEYLAQTLHTCRFEAMARQLHFTAEEAAVLDRKARRAKDPQRAFVTALRSGGNSRLILERTARFRGRLAAHLRRVAAVEPGDRIMLVDLGYAGTVQDRIEPFLRDEMGLDVRGGYFLLRDLPDRFDSKRGFIAADSIDGFAVDALCDFIALFEQLCAIEQGSVVDYSEHGAPVRRESGLASRQSAVRQAAQRGCLRFVADACVEPLTGTLQVEPEALRQAGVAALARLLFLPSADELALFKGFEHDVNMGVDDKVLLFDPEACRDALRDRGLFYVNDNPRQFLPAELRTNGLPLTLTLLAQRRFALDLRPQDFGLERITLPLMVADGHSASLAQIDAFPTHDGYYLARIPIGRCEYSIGVLFGRDYRRVQIASASLTRNDRLHAAGDLTQALDVLPRALHEGAELDADGLLTLGDTTAFSYFEAPALDRNFAYNLNLVFRPIQRREPRARQEAASAVATVTA